MQTMSNTVWSTVVALAVRRALKEPTHYHLGHRIGPGIRSTVNKNSRGISPYPKRDVSAFVNAATEDNADTYSATEARAISSPTVTPGGSERSTGAAMRCGVRADGYSTAKQFSCGSYK